MTHGALDPEQQRLMDAWKAFIAPPGEETLRFRASTVERLRTAIRAEIDSVLAERKGQETAAINAGLATLRAEIDAGLDWRGVVMQRGREIEEFRARGITLPPWAASEERVVSQSRSQEETRPSSRCAAWLRKVVRFLRRRSELQSPNREKRV